MEEASDVEEPSLDISQMMSIYNTILATSNKFNDILNKCNDLSWDGSKGLTLLDVKTDTMLSYLINLTYLVLKKSCGQSIEDVETRERLVNMRVILEKIKPLEEKLKYQIEKMVKSTITGESSATDKSSYRANVDDLDTSSSENEGEDEGDVLESQNESGVSKSVKVYRPPKLAAVPYNDESKAEKQQKLLENAKRRALNSSVMQELKEEYLDTPLEISTGTTLRNTHTKYRKERDSYEEAYFTRLPQTKKERHREKLMSSLTVGTLGSEITRFEDISALEGQLPSTSKKRKRKSLTKNKKKKGFKRRKTM